MEQVLSNPAVRLGRTWFQWRSFGPFPLLFFLLVLPPNFVLGPMGFVLVGLGIILSEAVRIWAVGYAGSVTRTRGDDVPVLVHAGPFRYVRNPLYIANVSMYACVSLFYGFSTLTLLAVLYFAVQYTFIVRFEESTLQRLFGTSYDVYCEKVSRWWPSIEPSIESSEHQFDLKASLRSERSTLIAIAVILTLFFIKSNFI